jgi:hypothetical protein
LPGADREECSERLVLTFDARPRLGEEEVTARAASTVGTMRERERRNGTETAVRGKQVILGAVCSP